MNGFPLPARVAVAFAVALAATTLAPPGGAAQYERSPEPAAYALQDATVLHGDGNVSEGVTVVVRNGVVEALGADVEPPPDAEVLEGDALHVLPGFVDPYGHATMDLPEVDREDVEAWNPTRELQRFTPRRTAREHLAATGPDLETRRELGVVASVAFPGRGMLPGQGALLLHRRDASEPRDLVVDSPMGVALALQGAPGVYPATLFGVKALLRQAFMDAHHTAQSEAAFEADPRGMAAPARDADFEVLRRVADGELPVFARADGAEDIRRILSLADELGFDPIIVGGEEAWRVADELTDRDVPVAVSLDFPEPDDWDPEEDGAELDPSAERERQELEDIYANAARLAEAGVRFAFTSAGASGRVDFREGARKAVEYGLPEEAALAALTAEPAALVGLPHLGRVEEGGGATFVVTDGPFFDEESRIAYTFVEGRLERVSPPDEGLEETDEPPADLAGRWSVEVRFGGQVFDGTMVVEQDEASFTGVLESDMGESEIRSGEIAGPRFRMEILPQGAPPGMTIELRGEVEGDDLTASGQGPEGMGQVELRGSREPGAAHLLFQSQEGGDR